MAGFRQLKKYIEKYRESVISRAQTVPAYAVDGDTRKIRQTNIQLLINEHGVGSTNGVVFLNWKRALEIANDIDTNATGANYSSLKNKEKWMTCYSVRKYLIPHINQLGELVQQELIAVPCHYCGVIIPIKCSQLDHYEPRKSRRDAPKTPVADQDQSSIIKVLRALGCTIGEASKGKGYASLQAPKWEMERAVFVSDAEQKLEELQQQGKLRDLSSLSDDEVNFLKSAKEKELAELASHRENISLADLVSVKEQYDFCFNLETIQKLPNPHSNPILYPKFRECGVFVFTNQSRSEKWQLNEEGVCFVSLIWNSPEKHAVIRLKALCLNSFFNISPYCSACNKSKSNQVKPIEEQSA